MEKTRANIIGYRDAMNGISNTNSYKRKSKIIEYETGYKDGMKEKMKMSFKNKPQLIHNSVARHNKKRMTISIYGGIIRDVVRENIDCELIIHDYDMEGIDVENNIHCREDNNGEWYQEIHL